MNIVRPWHLAVALAFLLMLGAPPLSAQGSNPRLQVSPVAGGVSLDFSWAWFNGCGARISTVERTGYTIAVHVVGGPGDGSPCFSAIRPYSESRVVTGLPDGRYTVEVTYAFLHSPGTIVPWASFSFDLPLPSGGLPPAPARAAPIGGPVSVILLTGLILMLAASRRVRATLSGARWEH
jgi:hypothetical protein